MWKILHFRCDCKKKYDSASCGKRGHLLTSFYESNKGLKYGAGQ